MPPDTKKPTWSNHPTGAEPRRLTRQRASRPSRAAPHLVIRLGARAFAQAPLQSHCNTAGIRNKPILDITLGCGYRSHAVRNCRPAVGLGAVGTSRLLRRELLSRESRGLELVMTTQGEIEAAGRSSWSEWADLIWTAGPATPRPNPGWRGTPPWDTGPCIPGIFRRSGGSPKAASKPPRG